MLVPEENILSVALWEWFVRQPRGEDWTLKERLRLSRGWARTIGGRGRKGDGEAVRSARREAFRRVVRLGSWEAVIGYTERALEVERAEAEVLEATLCPRFPPLLLADAVGDARAARQRLLVARRELEKVGRP